MVGTCADSGKRQSNKRKRISSSTYDETTRPTKLSRHSDQRNASEQGSIQSATSPTSPRLVNDRDTHTSENSPDSFDEMPSPPEGNLSNSRRITEPEPAHYERASETTAQTLSSPSSCPSRSATSNSWPGVAGLITGAGISQAETGSFRGVQSNYSNTWASSTAMIADAVVSDRASSSINDIPRPDASDAWANSTWMESAYFHSDLSLADDIPRPGASDAWANSTWMESGYFHSDRSPADNIPRSGASDTCANSYASMPGTTSLGSHMGNVLHPEPSGALDSVLAINSTSTSTSQPNSTALWTDMAEVIPVRRAAEGLRAREIVQVPTSGAHVLSPSSLQPDRFQYEAGNRQYSRAVVMVN